MAEAAALAAASEAAEAVAVGASAEAAAVSAAVEEAEVAAVGASATLGHATIGGGLSFP